MLTEGLGYEHGFKKPEKGGQFFGEYGVDLTARIIWASHDGRSSMDAENTECSIRNAVKGLSQEE